MANSNTIAIIGAGIAGCTTAHALAKRGYKVLLFERNAQVASEASGNQQGLLYPRLSGDQLGNTFTLACYLYSLNFYQNLKLPSHLIDFKGILQLAFNAREKARIEKVAQIIPSTIAQKVSAAQASALAGIKLEHEALFLPNAATLQPKGICEALLQHKNISVFTSNDIDNILINNDLFEIQSNKNFLARVNIVVFTCANEAENFHYCDHLETIKVRGQLTQLRAVDFSQQLKMPICTEGYLLPENNGHHTLGATFSFEDLNQVTDQAHLENLAKLKTMSANLYQHLQNQVCGGRVAFRCATKDHLPLVGQLLDASRLNTHIPRASALNKHLPWINNLFVNVGHGSHGFCSAPLTAEVIASIISQQTLPLANEVVGQLNPNRFLLKKLGLKRLAKMAACKWIEAT
jgi:tRNA 5-methylaminomethyl-2-thiouridine biosynthesis bifunctional protein